MKRIPIEWSHFLEGLTDPGLSDAEHGLFDTVRDPRALPEERTRAARLLLEGMIRRRRLALISRFTEDGAETLLLFDPGRRARFRIRLPETRAGQERIPLPLMPADGEDPAYRDIQQLLTAQSNLIEYDRVLSPRELASRFQHLLTELLPGIEAQFFAVEIPARSAWPSIVWEHLPLERSELEAAARERTHLIRGTHSSGGSFLVLPVGDDQVGWNGFLLLESAAADFFGPSVLGRAELAAGQFGALLSTLMRLEGLIFYDFLTGIYNRSYYEEQIEKEIRLALRRDQSMALLIVDIDDFKAFNTQYGYDGGDRVLATVACVLKSALRGTDTLARYGGEEFAIILAPPVPREEAIGIAERLRAAVAEEPFEIQDLDGNPVRERITVSIGGVLFPEHGTTARELWGRANRLVLTAKAEGKNTVRFAGPGER